MSLLSCGNIGVASANSTPNARTGMPWRFNSSHSSACQGELTRAGMRSTVPA